MENEATSATTRQYAPQQPANSYDAPYQSQLAQARFAPDNRSNNQTPDTSRLYHDQMAPNYPNYPANYQQVVVKKPGAMKWVLITLICILLVSGGISAMVISAIRAKRAAAERLRGDIRDAIERAKQDAQGASEAPGAPAPSTPPLIRGAGLEQYKYPNADVKRSVGVFGNEVVTMTTSDSVSEVGNYYKKRLGDPMVEDDEGATVIFNIPGSPTILITINEDKNDSDKTQITVLRSNIQLPKIN